jgi:superoxide dismutase
MCVWHSAGNTAFGSGWAWLSWDGRCVCVCMCVCVCAWLPYAYTHTHGSHTHTHTGKLVVHTMRLSLSLWCNIDTRTRTPPHTYTENPPTHSPTHTHTHTHQQAGGGQDHRCWQPDHGWQDPRSDYGCLGARVSFILQNAFSYHRMCSLTIECVLTMDVWEHA